MKLRRKATSVLITASVIVIFLSYFIFNTEDFKPLLDIDGYLLIIIALANIAGVFTNGLFTKFILEPFKKYISISEAFYVSVISSIGNFFAPAGTGFGIRAIYLKKKHGLPYSEFMSTLSGNYILVFLTSSLIGLISLYLLKDQYNGQYLVLALVFGLVFIVSLALSLIRIKLPNVEPAQAKKVNPMINNLYRVLYGWSKIAADRQLVFKLAGLVIANLVVATLMYWAVITSLGLTAKLPALLLFTVLGSFTIFINVTPANLGIKEAVFIFSSTVLGFSVSQILLIAIVDRGVQFVVLISLWLLSVRLKSRQFIQESQNQD
ncbi:MAG TPA: lysylphosphatidylglycerol synthase transmembrane domain-containing protein [Candidatus Saccharimonadales bacterium]|nr:lysylphosphatidylglycerol synthase transmembrane domain-containing protein [Candidatus Saccharimonadales bacterium]